MAVGLTPRIWSFPTKILWSIKSKALRKSSRAVLTDAPVPSVARNQWWNIEISANGRTGMKPNWPGSIWDNTTGFRAFSITKLSAIFDMVEVSEIGRRALLKSKTIGASGGGGTSASFHTRGTMTGWCQEWALPSYQNIPLGPRLECRLGHSYEKCWPHEASLWQIAR